MQTDRAQPKPSRKPLTDDERARRREEDRRHRASIMQDPIRRERRLAKQRAAQRRLNKTEGTRLVQQRYRQKIKKMRAEDPNKDALYRERYRKYQQRHRARHKEQVREKKKLYYEKNKQHIAVITRAWEQKNPERVKAKYQRKWEKKKLRGNPESVLTALARAVPPGLPKQIREDITQSMCLAILEGKLLAKNIKNEVAKFLAAYNREYDGFKTLSLDAEMPGTKKRYIDNVAADQEHF